MLETEVRRHSLRAPWTYADLDRRQREIQAEILRADAPGKLLLSEVAPVVTVGARTESADVRASELALAGVSVLPVDRGGFGTYHGPGQWVLFAVERLDRLTGDSRGVRKAVDLLLDSALAVAQEFGVDAEVKAPPCAGLWTRRGKLASIGVRVSGRVLLHGIALNVYRQGPAFAGIRPCGMDTPADFLFQGAPIDERFVEVGSRWISAFSAGIQPNEATESRVDA